MIRINDLKFRATLKAAVIVGGFLLFAAAMGFGQQQVNLTAGPTTLPLPDGTVVPMWGYSCGALASGATATCAALNPNAVTTAASATAGSVMNAWSPVVITVPAASIGATSLTISLTNSLSFTPTGGTTANTIPTSIVIVGQVGGGLGTLAQRTTTASPDHSNAQGCVTWFIADPTNTPPGTPCPQTATSPVSGAYPPTQANRVQSFSTEVAAGATTALKWSALRPGTYLLESGTHPSIQVPMGLIGVLVVTTAPSATSATGTAYPAVGTAPAVTYNAELPLEFSEIDPVQNKAVSTAVNTAGFSETKVWDGHLGACGDPNAGAGVANTCYPPAVNYTPFYYLINGLAFSKNLPGNSLFPAVPGTPAAPAAGTVLVRLVNAGLRMHVPSIVGSLTQGFTGAGVATTSTNPVSGFTLIAEDGNPVPNLSAPRVQTDVFMAAGKTFDVMINAPAAGSTAPALPVYDRELSLSGNSSVRDAGMLAYIGINGAALPVAGGTGVFAPAQANPDTYDSLAPGQTFTVSDTSKGVIANDVNVYGVTILAGAASGIVSCPLPGSPVSTLTAQYMCANGTFTYTPSGTATSDSFTYCANGTVTGTTCSSGLIATVTFGASLLTGNPTAIPQSYTAKMATYLKIPSPGLLLGNTDPNNLPLTVVPSSSASVVIDQNGGFNASGTAGSTTAFSYTVRNSQGRTASGTATVTFPTGNGPTVTVVDAQAYNNCNGDSTCIKGLTAIADYRWIIEEDKTFWVDPNCTTTGSITAPGCPHVVGPTGQSTIPTQGVQFHSSTMDYVAQGCTGTKSCEGGQTFLNPLTGTHDAAVCDVGNGACRPDPNKGTLTAGFTQVMPSSVHLDPSKRYYISVLPGDAGDPFPAYVGQPTCTSTGKNPGDLGCGHTMGGAQIPPACNVLTGCTAASTAAFAPVTVLSAPTPLPTGKLSLIVFEDDFPLNGEQDAGGGIDVLSPNEPGLGGFEIILWDTYGSLGDVTGQDTHDMFNMPLSNSLAGTIDPSTGLDACPISAQATADPTQAGITGRIVTCPKYESDNATLSPLAGQAVVANLMSDKFSVQAYPAADRIARGEEWLQTNTLDGQHPHDSFIRVGEPSYFQEYGPAGYHVSIGFANPKLINDRHDAVCAGSFGAVGACNNTIEGQVDVQRLSRTPDQRLYPSGSRDALAWTQCWVSLGDPDAEDFMFTKCDANGNFKFTGVPGGNWRLTIGDQWNDQIIDGLSTPANVGCVIAPPATSCPAGTITDLKMGSIGVQQWQANVYTRTFVDDNKNGIRDKDEIGIPLVYTMIHYRDGSRANVLTTDFDGVANFNETFPLFNWYVVTADSGRYKTTGIHTVYDAGGPADGSKDCGPGNGARPCGTPAPNTYQFLANTYEAVPLPADLSVPGAVYCKTADCLGEAASFAAGTAILSSTDPTKTSTGRIDPPWVAAEGWSGETSQGNWIEFGKAPFAECNPALPASATNFCVSVPNSVTNPNAGVQPITAATESGSTVTVTSALVPNVGDTVVIAGATPAGYNGTFTVTTVGTGNFSYTDTVTTLGAGTGGTATDTAVGGGTTASTIPVGENGGIHGLVKYAATRPFDDASQMIEQPWAPNVARVTVNLYQEGFAADGATPTLKLVDTTQSTSWDDWAQGFYPGSTAGSGTGAGQKPYMNCPGQGTATGANADLFFFTLYDQPNYLNYYNSLHGGPALNTTTLPYNSQYKCYDAMHIWNQIQPAPYDGMYSFPSVVSINPTTGKAAGLTAGISAISETGTIVAVTTSAPDGFNSGSTVTIAGVTPAGYDGSFVITVTSPTSFTYTAASGLTAAVVTTSSTATGPATNCTICVANPDTTDKYRVGTPMLPPGKYVVEVIMPPGYEVEKEEDKNLLIGDNYIAPPTQQFPGLGGSIFIMPDQASVASMYDPSGAGYNPTNYQNATTAEGNGNYLALPGYPGFQDPIWPCVGEMRVVPDYLSLFPQVQETAPFAGATRPLCDRKEVTLASQDSVSAKFYIFTSTHIASHFTGVITDDFTSEFDPFSPQFGEKFSPPNMPVSTRDYLGNEVSRVYSDHWGIYDGLNFSSWDVNPPNITGYAPAMMVQCMNDYGPILDTNSSSPTYGQMINDPLYNQAYSDFCYTEPYMPGTTTYLDTPVVPTQAFVGAGYNNPDCAYPDATPSIAEVDGDGIGPWVAAAGHTITITALGNATAANASSCTAASTGADVTVNNFGYAGPSASVPPFDCKTISRHYGFGSQGAASSVTIGGVPAVITGWADNQITVAVPGPTGTCTTASSTCNPTPVPNCTIQQQTQYGGSTAQCGQLLITAANGKQSIDTVTVTIGGSTPTHVPASGTIQGAIDAAHPGDLIIVDPTCSTAAGPEACPAPGTAGVTHTAATHTEMVIMWKPVRLQGAGAASTIINANAHPAGKLLDPWRRHINCLFGLTVQGVGSGNTSPYDVSGTYSCPETSWAYFKATAQAVSAPITAINVTNGGGVANGGINYTSNPTVHLGGDIAPVGGTLAQATATVDTNSASPTFGQVISITVTSGGSGYTSAPAITFSGGGGSGAAAVATQAGFMGGTVVTGADPQIDRLPSEAVVGWDATLNGNLAELLQEPSLMGAYEGAGITVLGKGANMHGGNPWDQTLEGGFPAGSTLLVSTNGTVTHPETLNNGRGNLKTGDSNPVCTMAKGTNPYPSNFICNPSSIDGLTITNSSQGGGGILIHGWAHVLQVANNRIYNNAGTLSGGISVGQGEFGPPYVMPVTTIGNNLEPGTCSDTTGFVNGQHLPWCLDLHVNVHNNMITNNSSIGDELFSATLSGGGGASFCTGNDYYKFNFNWVCGNISAGEGGGVVHLGEIFNGDIEHNSIIFNESSNPTIPTNGGGIMVQGTPDTDPVCGSIPDADCPPGLSDGTGPGLVINANLIQGNSADSGSGGGIRLQSVNGTDVSTFASQPQHWNDVTITNNIINNNMAGWDGAGISLQDALNVQIINNTIAHNDTLASSGVLTQSIGTPQASASAGNCTMPGPTGLNTASCPQSAGVTSVPNSSLLTTTFVVPITCPTGRPNCKGISDPILANNIVWQNRSFHIGITAPGTGQVNQQNLVALFNAGTNTAVPAQTATGVCSGGSYWDLGVRGDQWQSGATPNNASGFILNPTYSVLTNTTGYPATNSSTAPPVVAQYCNGSRVPPECTAADGCGGPSGFGVPPGIPDSIAGAPRFSLVPSATVDEGNNWINVSWGPLSLTNPSVTGGTYGSYGGGLALGNYALTTAMDTVPSSQPHPATDFFGNPRPDPAVPNRFDVGAVEFQGAGTAVVSVTPTALTFSAVVGTTSAAQTLTVSNTGSANFTGAAVAVTAPFSRPGGAAGGTCAGTLNAGASCLINIVFSPTTGTPCTPTACTGSATITGSVAVTGSPVSLTGNGIPQVVSATLAPSSWAPTANRGVVSGGFFGCLFGGANVGPCQAFTLTNTGNVPLTTIAQGALSGANASDWAIVRLLSTCGPAGGGQLLGQVTLAPGASCNIEVQFRPVGTDTASPPPSVATLSVADAAGTQTASLSGTITYAPLTLTPAGTTNFGTVRVAGTTGATRTFTVAGAAGTPVTWAFGGTNAGDFTRNGGTCGGAQGSAIPAAGSCTIVVRFKPLSATPTSRAGTMTVPGSTPVTLTGTATP